MVTTPSKRSGSTAGSTPPTTLVPPPNGMTAAFAPSAHSRTASISPSSAGWATTSGGWSNRPRKARTTSR